MSYYRKKPVVIEAMRLDFAVKRGGQHSNYRQIIEWTRGMAFADMDVLVIPTLEGDMCAQDGDYIIKGLQGEFYPCKPDIFAATYEQVSGAFGD